MALRKIDFKLISSNLKKARIDKGFSIEEVSTILDQYTHKDVLEYEECFQTPTLSYVVDFCNGLKADIDLIMCLKV